MTLALAEQELRECRPAPARRDMAALFGEGCRRAGANGYVIVDALPSPKRLSPRILASDWTYDAMQAVGLEALFAAAESPAATALGTEPRGWSPLALAALIDCPSLAELHRLGHRQVFVLKLTTASRRCSAICCARLAGAVDTATLMRLQMRACYALSSMPEMPAQAEDPLSDRERECLAWVSQGKTTDEVSLILEVSSNTVNSYIAHAIHKLGAANRAMAVATAVRRGIV